MKVTSLITLLVSSLLVASAPAAAAADGSLILLLGLDYTIKEFPGVGAADVAELTNGKTISIEHTIVNHEDKNVTIVGIGGSFLDAKNLETKTNLTSSAIGPHVLGPEESFTFIQQIPLNLVPDNYVLVPQLFVAVEDELRLIPLRGQLSIVSDESISFFNPQLLFLEAILIASVGFLAYVIYEIWGKRYLGIASSTPITKKKVVGEKKSVDSSWLPKEYKKKTA